MKTLVLTTLMAALLLPGVAARGGEPGPPELEALRGISVDAKAHRVTVEGYVCLEEGILEYLAVVAGGREYESVLALQCKPSGLHAALLLAGGEPGDLDPELVPEELMLPDGAKPTGRPGARFNVSVRWTDGDRRVEMPAAALLLSRKTNRTPKPAPFVFTGSYFIKDTATGKDLYMADLDGGLLATFYDIGAILNLPAAEGNPYQGDDLGFELNRENAPPKDTKVQVILELVKPEPPNEAADE